MSPFTIYAASEVRFSSNFTIALPLVTVTSPSMRAPLAMARILATIWPSITADELNARGGEPDPPRLDQVAGEERVQLRLGQDDRLAPPGLPRQAEELALRPGAVRGGFHTVSVQLEEGAERLARVGIVFDEKHHWGCRRGAGGGLS